ncbi:hypothetical protein [Streptomyces sp. NPDC002851]
MIYRSRLALGAGLAVTAAVVLTGCGNPNGLAAGEPAPSVAVQPSPAAVWPSWSGASPESPGADTTAHQPPPEPLPAALKVPEGGLGKLKVRDLLRADSRMRPYADRPLIHEPGRSGIRPPKLVDLTGDGADELLVAVDTESGSTVLSGYREQNGRVVPILYARGKRVAIETVGADLVLRSPCANGAEQAVRYRWDGSRMVTMSDTKTYTKPDDAPSSPAPKPTRTSAPSGTSAPARTSAPPSGPAVDD